jgi:hypothetical protein
MLSHGGTAGRGLGGPLVGRRHLDIFSQKFQNLRLKAGNSYAPYMPHYPPQIPAHSLTCCVNCPALRYIAALQFQIFSAAEEIISAEKPCMLVGLGGIGRSAGFDAVMLFSDRLSEQEVLEAKTANRENLLETLLRDFRTTFPNLTFELQLDFPIINAQAFALEDRRIVTIYGGLALHPKLGPESLAFIILHEAGHHLARGCRSTRDRFLACECASDYWAVTVGTDTLLQKSGRRLRMRAALEELSQIMSPRQPSKGSYTKRTSTSGCWARGWSLRSRALLERARPPTIKGCCITYV